MKSELKQVAEPIICVFSCTLCFIPSQLLSCECMWKLKVDKLLPPAVL